MAKETWILKDSLRNDSFGSVTLTFNFTANGEQFIGTNDVSGDFFEYVKPDNSTIRVISWMSGVQAVDWEKYRKITLAEPATGEVLTWLNKWADKYEAFDGKINITKSAGVVLKTQGKYCDQDITVVPTLEEKSVTPTESAQEITPSDGNCGISKLNVGAVQTETKTITPTTSQQTFTPTSGKYFKQVICQAIQAYQGTATPAKGEQTITPTSGKFFSSFKVGAIPSDYVIPSGTLQITTNGVKDVTNYKNVNVNVEPNLEQKTVTITTNGTTDVTPTSGKDGMSKVTVTTNVPTSPIEEVATASAMNALLVEANVGKYYKFTGTTDSNYTNGDLYLVEGAVSSHTLTIEEQYSYSDKVTVNDNNITSPYTLQNGDVIKVPTQTQGITINGTSYSTRDESVLNISNEDIVVTRTGAEKVIDPVPYITINYTA